MAFEQQIHQCSADSCPVGDDCTVIVGVLDGIEVWRSHMHSSVPAEHRLNIDYPEAIDHRGEHPRQVLHAPVTDSSVDACKKHWPGFDPKNHRSVSQHG